MKVLPIKKNCCALIYIVFISTKKSLEQNVYTTLFSDNEQWCCSIFVPGEDDKMLQRQYTASLRGDNKRKHWKSWV